MKFPFGLTQKAITLCRHHKVSKSGSLMHVFCTLDWFILYTISTFGEWNCTFWYYVTIIIVRTVKWNARSFTFWPQHLIIQEMRRKKWCCFAERSSNLLTIANCYSYCKTNNEDNEVLWGYFVVTTKLPHTCRSYSSFRMIKTLKDGAKYATSTFPIMHLICPPKFGITICDFQSGIKIIFSLHDIRMKFHSEWKLEWLKHEQNVVPLSCKQIQRNIWKLNDLILEWVIPMSP